jgi:hypothetical protein
MGYAKPMMAFAWVALTSFDPSRESPEATSSVTRVTPTAMPFLPTQPPPMEAPAPRPLLLTIQSPAQFMICVSVALPLIICCTRPRFSEVGATYAHALISAIVNELVDPANPAGFPKKLE